MVIGSAPESMCVGAELSLAAINVQCGYALVSDESAKMHVRNSRKCKVKDRVCFSALPESMKKDIRENGINVWRRADSIPSAARGSISIRTQYAANSAAAGPGKHVLRLAVLEQPGVHASQRVACCFQQPLVQTYHIQCLACTQTDIVCHVPLTLHTRTAVIFAVSCVAPHSNNRCCSLSSAMLLHLLTANTVTVGDSIRLSVDCNGNIICSISNRLVTYAEGRGLLHTAQNAFRRGRSTDDHVYCLSEVIKGRQRGGLPTYAFFLDLSKAYDTVWRDGLLYKLWQQGIRGPIWQYIRAMYTTTARSVRCGDATSGEVHVDLGTAQGDTLSCVLFDLFIDDLVQAAAASTRRCRCVAGQALSGTVVC